MTSACFKRFSSYNNLQKRKMGAKTKTARAALFPYDLHYKELNLRQHPEWYRTGKGEQGVLMVEPYKSELLPHWRFKTPPIAQKSADALFAMFEDYKQQNDFVGCDMARKFIQMGVTRSRRYANHVGGRKYKDKERTILIPKPEKEDEEKATSAKIFGVTLNKVKMDPVYKKLADDHFRQYNHIPIDTKTINSQSSLLTTSSQTKSND